MPKYIMKLSISHLPALTPIALLLPSCYFQTFHRQKWFSERKCIVPSNVTLTLVAPR